MGTRAEGRASRRSSLLAASLSLLAMGCGPGTPPLLAVDLMTDHRPGIDFTRVRTELSAEPFTSGGTLRVSQVEYAVRPADDYGAPVRVAELETPPRRIAYLRVSLLDASGRVRGQRLATVEASTTRAITLVIGTACRAVTCPGATDDPGATACVNGVCVPPTCLPEAPETCGPATCAGDAECPEGRACQRASCNAGTCLLLDACGEGETCGESGCVPAPRCGDGACDPGSESPCACEADCGSCPAGCLDGVCGPAEGSLDCPEDCGPPPASCGDGVCEHAEDCPDDCAPGPPPAPRCGDPGCTSCEECDLCCDEGCGDGACREGESACACPADCGPCSVCGDARCDAGEDCPDDCTGAAVCRDGVCLAGMGESCGSCQDDCGWCGFGLPEIDFDRACVGESGTGAGETCGDLEGAWTSADVNVAYYPMQVGQETDLISGDTWDGGGGIVLATLGALTPVGVQSTRNPRCSDSPPLRAGLGGYVFAYVRGVAGTESSVGWIRAEDLILDDARAGTACANGPTGEAFQIASNPYSREPLCQSLDCTGERRCREANPTGEGGADCGGRSVRYERTVNADTLQLRYAPAGPGRRYLHRGDRVRVLYQSGRPEWVFVMALTTAAPDLSPVGSRGWVLASYLME